MAEQAAAPADVPLDDWLAQTHRELGPASGSGLTPDERAALLDLARVAAHRSQRIAAPLTTFIAGAALGALPAGDRATALRSLVDRLGGLMVDDRGEGLGASGAEPR
jgi:hypothetical protein